VKLKSALTLASIVSAPAAVAVNERLGATSAFTGPLGLLLSVKFKDVKTLAFTPSLLSIALVNARSAVGVALTPI
jgi:hypothetical protein